MRGVTTRGRRGRGLLWGVLCLVWGCGRPQVPPPETARDEYVAALKQADAEGLREMMTARAKREYSAREIGSLLRRDALEFRERVKRLSEARAADTGEATVYLLGGRTASLSLAGGKFWITSAGLVPEMPRTPEEAAEALRRAVRERDYAKIERTLSSAARGNFSRSFDSLEQSLSDLDSAIVNVREDQARIEFLDGRVITLKLEGAAWRVESFE
jgi:hypothetical protein